MMNALIDVHQQNGVLVTTSRNIAKVFEKEHFHVLRDIRDILKECSLEFGASNFGCSSYKTEQNKEATEYFLTKDGFVLLVMGYTGEKAMRFKEAYIKAFNEMEVLLKKQQEQVKKIDWDSLEREVRITGDALDKTALTPNQKGLALNQLLKEATGKDYFAIMGVHLEEPEPKEEEELLTPTEIGTELGISNQVVNQLLKKVGLQYKPENSSIWFPTEKGIEQGARVINVCKKASIGTTTQLKWSPKVISILRNYLE